MSELLCGGRCQATEGSPYNAAMILFAFISKRSIANLVATLCVGLLFSGCNKSDTNKFTSDTPNVVYAEGQQLAQNPGFEEAGSPAPRGWSWDLKRSGNKGSVS